MPQEDIDLLAALSRSRTRWSFRLASMANLLTRTAILEAIDRIEDLAKECADWHQKLAEMAKSEPRFNIEDVLINDTSYKTKCKTENKTT